MTQFRNVWNMIFDEHKTGADQETRTTAEQQEEDSTMKAAGKVSQEIGRPLSRAERRKAGPFVHYTFGTSVGAVFGLATEAKPKSLRGVNPVLVGGRLRRCCFPGCARTCSSSVETIFESSQGTRAGPNRRIYLALDLWFAAEISYFSECILKNREPEPSGQEGLADIRVIEGIYKAVKSMSVVKLPAFEKKRRPTMRQEIRKQPHGKPETIHVTPPSGSD